MAKSARIQPYPRVQHRDGTYNDLLDDSKLVSHTEKIPLERLQILIKTAFQDANKKSSRAILAIPAEADKAELQAIYETEGRKLLKYFKQYCVDPPKTAREATGKHYRDVGLDLFRRRSLQSERMNTGW